MEASVSYTEQSDIVAEVGYGDGKLFAELARLHDYFYEWRRDHPNQPIIYGSPIASLFLSGSCTRL